MKYVGSCHCNSVEFEIQTDTIEQALQCNCSICSRKNAVMSKDTYDKSQFVITKGAANLSTYRWGDEVVNHYFCRTCGIYPFHDNSIEPGKYRVNLGCIHGLELSTIKISHFDGKHEL